MKRFFLGFLLFLALATAPGHWLAAETGLSPVIELRIKLMYQVIDLLKQLIQKIEDRDRERGREKQPPAPPVIYGISPVSGPAGTKVTVQGANFTPENNTLYTGYGPIVLPSADGRTLVFTFSPPGAPANLPSLKKADFPSLAFGIYVVNQNGQTTDPALFTFVP